MPRFRIIRDFVRGKTPKTCNVKLVLVRTNSRTDEHSNSFYFLIKLKVLTINSRKYLAGIAILLILNELITFQGDLSVKIE